MDIEVSGEKISLDDEGYLINVNDWNEGVARALARREGMDELTKDRFEIILFMRDYYLKYSAFPILRGVCRNAHKPKDCFSDLFLDPVKAWKIAGLPVPDPHVVAELRGEGGVV